MINDLTDLEPVLLQYDTGKVLVGPLLNLSINSSFRFFYIAGKGKKIYESVGLGFVELESDAQRRRADIVAQMQSRFGEVKILDNQLELAREAHTLWANEETRRFLATAAPEAKVQMSTAVSQNEPAENANDVGDRTDSGKRLDPEPPRSTLTTAIANAYESWPLNSELAKSQQRDSALQRDDIALAVLGLKSSTATIANSGTDTATVASVEAVPKAVVERSSRWGGTKYRLRIAASAAAFIAAMIIVTSTRYIANEVISALPARQSAATGGGNDVSAATRAVNVPSPRSQIAAANNTNDTAPQTAPSPPLRAAEVAPAQHAAPPVAQAQSPQSPTAGGQSVATPDSLPSRAPNAARAQIAPPLAQPQSPPSEAAHDQAPTASVEAASRAAEVLGAQAGAVPTARPVLSPSPPSQRQDAQVETGYGRQSPPSWGAGAQAEASPDKPPAMPPAVAPAPSGAAPVSQPQSPPARIASAEVRSGPEPQATKGANIIKSLSAGELAGVLNRGSAFLKTGDFAAARVLLRRAAESGSAEAALMLGKTFDPLFLNEVGAIGIRPDMAQARQWYQKAVELGSEAAAQRLANLAQRGQ